MDMFDDEGTREIHSAVEDAAHDRRSGRAKLAKNVTLKFIKKFDEFAEDVLWELQKPSPESES
jgi:hypothetical protein